MNYKKGSYKRKRKYVLHKLLAVCLLVVAFIQFGKIYEYNFLERVPPLRELLKRDQIAYIAGAVCVFLIFYLLYKQFPRWQKRKKYRGARMYEIDRMEGTQFEQFLAVFFKDLGYKVLSETGGRGDMGSDLLLQAPDQRKIVVQAKRYAGKVPFKAIQEVHTAQSLYGAHGAILISNNYFSKQTKETAQKLNIELWDRNKLIDNMYVYRKKKREA